MAGGERVARADDLRPAGLAPEAVEDLEHAEATRRGDQAADPSRRAVRLVSAVLREISEDWETNRKYLTMEPA